MLRLAIAEAVLGLMRSCMLLRRLLDIRCRWHPDCSRCEACSAGCIDTLRVMLQELGSLSRLICERCGFDVTRPRRPPVLVVRQALLL